MKLKAKADADIPQFTTMQRTQASWGFTPEKIYTAREIQDIAGEEFAWVENDYKRTVNVNLLRFTKIS